MMDNENDSGRRIILIILVVGIQKFAIRIGIIMFRTGCQYSQLESKDYYCRYDFGLHIALMSNVSPTWDASRSCCLISLATSRLRHILFKW